MSYVGQPTKLVKKELLS